MSRETCLELLDPRGRMNGDNKVGSIPAELSPNLERLGIWSGSVSGAARYLERLGIWSGLWPVVVTTYHVWFGQIVGLTIKPAERAVQTARKWYRVQIMSQLFLDELLDDPLLILIRPPWGLAQMEPHIIEIIRRWTTQLRDPEFK